MLWAGEQERAWARRQSEFKASTAEARVAKEAEAASPVRPHPALRPSVCKPTIQQHVPECDCTKGKFSSACAFKVSGGPRQSRFHSWLELSPFVTCNVKRYICNLLASMCSTKAKREFQLLMSFLFAYLFVYLFAFAMPNNANVESTKGASPNLFPQPSLFQQT